MLMQNLIKESLRNTNIKYKKMKEIKAFIKSIKLEKVVQAIEIICGNAATPYTDGIIYLSDINDVYSIKTCDSLNRLNL